MARHPVLYSADLEGCRSLSGVPASRLTEGFAKAVERGGGTIVRQVTHEFPGAGLTCVLVLSESHAVLHTWPELDTINVDIFSCSTRLRGVDVIGELERVFEATRVTMQQNPRAGGADLSTLTSRA